MASIPSTIVLLRGNQRPSGKKWELSAVLVFQNAIGEILDLCLRRSELRECEPVFFDTGKPPTSADFCHFDEEIRVGGLPQNSKGRFGHKG